MRKSFFSLLLGIGFVALGCGPATSPADGGTANDGGALVDGGIDTGYPPPRDDFVLSVGSDDTLDLMTWNIENFPAQSSTPRLVADVITSLQMDVVAVQEITSTQAFDELAQRLPRHGARISSHTYGDGSYQKVGVLFREDLMTPLDVRLLFPGSGYEFPRPPLQVTFEMKTADGEPGWQFTLITLHLKAGQTQDDKLRRAGAMQLLEEHVRSLVEGPANDEIIILGDFNELLTDDDGRAVFGPFLVRPNDYRFQTESLAEQGANSFIYGERLIDHILTTTPLDDNLQGRTAVIPNLEGQVPGYASLLSDHLPVAISMPVFE
jgi:exonuclease III